MADLVKLPPNHLRSVSVSMQFLEKSVDELAKLFTNKNSEVSYEIIRNIPAEDIAQYIGIIKEIKQKIAQLNQKYELKKEVLYMSRIFNAKKTRMWEILSETNSRRLKGYGNLPDGMGEEIDADIKTLINLNKKLYSINEK
jgi:hypothetical protein